jgi:hypothetical protein
MSPRSPGILFALIVTLAIAAALAVCVESPAQRRRTAGSREFQQLVGGLGFGPAADLSRCAFSFDPRLCPDCAQNHGPIPAGVYFCPHHGCSILYYPSLHDGPEAPGE